MGVVGLLGHGLLRLRIPLPRAPRLAPNQPNGNSALASAMVAMDSQLQATLTAVMADPDHSWEGRRLVEHDLLGLDPTDDSMINGHYLEHAPLYALAVAQFNAHPSADHFNAVVRKLHVLPSGHLSRTAGPH